AGDHPAQRDHLEVGERTSRRGVSMGRQVIPIERPQWMDFAACIGADPEIFFPERGARWDEALEYCDCCRVREPCLQYALDHRSIGVWGGTTERQRKRLLKRLKSSTRP